jgi:hypothetical protein
LPPSNFAGDIEFILHCVYSWWTEASSMMEMPYFIAWFTLRCCIYGYWYCRPLKSTAVESK